MHKILIALAFVCLAVRAETAATVEVDGIAVPLRATSVLAEDGWCPKMYAASNKSVVDIEKSDGKCLNVIEHLLGKTAGFTHRTAYPLA